MNKIIFFILLGLLYFPASSQIEEIDRSIFTKLKQEKNTSVKPQIEEIDRTVFNQPEVKATPSPTPAKAIAETDVGEDLEMAIASRFPLRRVTGKVEDVHDGDTIRLIDEAGTIYKVRFNGIDAPEIKQEMGDKAQKSLAKMVEGKTVTIEFDKIDKYGRFVSKIFVDGKDVNLEQLKRGFAWHFKRYLLEQLPEDQKTYAEAEANAQTNKIGIWKKGIPEAPWEYRLRTKPPPVIIKDADGKIIKPERVYQTGAKGGCYYINAKGNKTYVDKAKCANPPPKSPAN